jgi:hypothetical protein
MGTGKKLIENTNGHEALKLHTVNTNKNRDRRELEETDNYGDDKG